MGRRLGIIPAYAGSTLVGGRIYAAAKDHPRVCGEHVIVFMVRPLLPGSSPRMRGARSTSGVMAGLMRIIPAYAGSTGATT